MPFPLKGFFLAFCCLLVSLCSVYLFGDNAYTFSVYFAISCIFIQSIHNLLPESVFKTAKLIWVFALFFLAVQNSNLLFNLVSTVAIISFFYDLLWLFHGGYRKVIKPMFNGY